MGMAHERSIGAMRNKKAAAKFFTFSSWKTEPRHGQRPRPQRLQSFQEELIGDKLKCWSFLGGRFVPTQSSVFSVRLC